MSTKRELARNVRFIPVPDFGAQREHVTRRFNRPSRYSEEVGERLCQRIMSTTLTLKQLCAEDDRLPSVRTVLLWLGNPNLVDFREMYYYARRVQAELRADEMFEIADNDENDWDYEYHEDGSIKRIVPNNASVQRARLQIDLRKWYTARLLPRIYGEKIDVSLEATGDLAELLKKAANANKGLPEPTE